MRCGFEERERLTGYYSQADGPLLRCRYAIVNPYGVMRVGFGFRGDWDSRCPSYRLEYAVHWEVLRDISALTLEFAGVVILYGVNSVANALMQSE